MTDLLESPTAAIPTVRRSTRLSRSWEQVQALRATRFGDAVLVGVIGLLVSVAFSWVPSVWYDESATIVSAQRTWAELWSEIHTVDAVHATYYALMHAWFAVVGYTPFSLRFPSAVAVGLAAALLATLARELTSKRTAVVAGLLFVLLPRVTWAGGEGRSYALSTALATAATLVFVLAAKKTRDDARVPVLWWALYGVLAFASTAVFLYSALLIVGHGVTMGLWLLRERRPGRGTPWRAAVGGWVVSAGVAGGLLVPLARLASSESKQISWIGRPGAGTIIDFGVWQWFMTNWWFAALGWILAVVGVVSVVRQRRAAERPGGALASQRFGVLQVVLPWMLVPSIGLIAVSLVGSPLYSPRYVTFAAPAMALLMAVGLTSLRPPRLISMSSRRLVAAGLVLAVAMTLPTYISQRLVEAKDSSSWSEVAALVAKERKLEGVNATDAIIYGHIRRHPTGSARNIAYAYPHAFTGMTDVTLKTPAAQTGALWETRSPLSSTIERVDGHTYVWLVTSTKQDLRPSVTKALAGEGFHLQDEWHLTWVNVLRYRL